MCNVLLVPIKGKRCYTQPPSSRTCLTTRTQDMRPRVGLCSRAPPIESRPRGARSLWRTSLRVCNDVNRVVHLRCARAERGGDQLRKVFRRLEAGGGGGVSASWGGAAAVDEGTEWAVA